VSEFFDKPSQEARKSLTELMAQHTGRRWCYHCRRDKPAQGFQKARRMWICAGCFEIKKRRGSL